MADNSLSKIVENFALSQNNALEILQALNTSTSSNEESVNVTITDDDGNAHTYAIMTQAYFKNSINRIDTTLKTMMGIGSDAYIKLPNGTFKKVFTYSLNQDPPQISSLDSVTAFDVNTNLFLEDMMSPSLFVNIPLGTSVPDNAKKLKTNRVIFDIITKEEKDWFDVDVNGHNDINYTDFLNTLEEKDIAYIEDVQNKDLPELQIRYSGNFTILKSVDSEEITQDLSVTSGTGTPITSEQNVIVSRNVKKYLFESLEYFDSFENRFINLATGDQIKVNDAIYEVTESSKTTNIVSLQSVSGYSILPLLDPDSISIYSSVASNKHLNINVSPNEYEVIFLKNIDDTTNIESTKWSNGVGFFTNDLVLTGSESTLNEYYNTNVIDYGRVLFDAARDLKISAYSGSLPNPPTINANNFRVTEINQHKLDSKKIKEVEEQASAKVSLFSEIQNVDKAIKAKRGVLNKKSFNSSTEEKKARNELSSLIETRTTKGSLYSSIVTELAAVSKTEPALKVAPKYRVRGFFELPAPVLTSTGKLQHAVQFHIRYKYLNVATETTATEQYNVQDSNNKVETGSFSAWTTIHGPVRERTYNKDSQEYEWKIEDISNADVENINQIDIPISPSEKVELQVRSISEAGFPINPIMSDWSESVIIEFPPNKSGETPYALALAEAEREEYHKRFSDEITSMGVPTHVSETIELGSHTYMHNASSILSGQYDETGNQLSEFEVIKRLKAEIETLKSLVNKVKPILSVYVIDTDSNVKHEIQNNTTLDLFAGYYDTEVATFATSAQKGAIISKNYQILLMNATGTPLELVSRLPGGLGEDLPESNVNGSDEDYDKRRQYDKVPIVQRSIDTSDTANGAKISPDLYMSQQLMSQFVYSRMKDIGLKTSLYYEPTNDTERYFNLIHDSSSGAASDANVWGCTFDATSHTPDGNGTLSEFCLSLDYPNFAEIYANVNSQNASATNPAAVVTALNQPKVSFVQNLPEQGAAVVPILRHSGLFNLDSSDVNGTLQMAYKLFDITPNVDNQDAEVYPDKFGFSNIDRYTIGKQTVGSYLILESNSLGSLLVDGTDYLAKRTLTSGEENGINLNLVFQYRMRDYYGTSGYAGGWSSSYVAPLNMTYSKKIGIDIATKDESVFSFDVKVSAKLKQHSVNERRTLVQKPSTTVFKNKTSANKADLGAILSR